MAIRRGKEIELTALAQAMRPDENDQDKLSFVPFDVTKVWPRSRFHMRESGQYRVSRVFSYFNDTGD